VIVMQSGEQRDEVEMLSLMLLIRRFEERASQQYQAQKIGGFCHLYIGQEAVVAGAIAAVRPMITSSLLIETTPTLSLAARAPTRVWPSFLERKPAVREAWAVSMHFFNRQTHMYGGHAIVGAHVPLAVGLAFAIKYRGEDRVTLCFFGDGAINQGSFHEALNLAALFKLPIVFHLRKQLFAMGTR